MIDINNIDINELSNVLTKQMEQKQKELKELEKLVEQTNKNIKLQQSIARSKTLAENYNKKKVSEHSTKERETAYNKHKDLLAMFYLKFSGVASREQFKTLTSENKALDEIKEYGLCKVDFIWGVEVFILHSFSISRMTNNKNAKTIRMTDNGIKYQLYTNNWNIRNGKWDDVYSDRQSISTIKDIEITRKGKIHKDYADDVDIARKGFYSMPYLQAVYTLVAIGVRTKNVGRLWKMEKSKIKATQGQKEKAPVKESVKNYDIVMTEIGYKGHFLFDIFRKGVINVNYVKAHTVKDKGEDRYVPATVYFDYLDKTMNIGTGKVEQLRELLEGLTNVAFIGEDKNPIEVRKVLNVHTSTSAKERLKKEYKPSGKSSVYVKFRDFDYSL